MKMKKLNYLLPIFFFGLATYSCSGNSEEEITEPAGHIITGDVKGAEGNMITMMVFEGGAEVVVDSCVVKDGKFELETKTKELREYIIFFDGEMPLILFLDEESKDVKINGSVPGIGENYTVSGSQSSIGIKDYLTFLKQFYEVETSITNQINSMNPADSNAIKPLMAKLDSISFIQRDYALERIEKDNSSPLSWLLLRELIPASGLLAFDSTDLGYFQKVSNAMRAKYPYSEYPGYIDMDIQSINTQYTSMNAPVVAAGTKVAPEILMNDYNGKPIALSSLRGKIVLIDFWASWCAPCRKENPNVVKTYEKYKDKGFTIYSVSLDENKDAWMKAITADNLSWPNHVSDLKGWSSDAVREYNVTGIPATFLLDKEGIIIGENLRGAELENKLKEVLP